MAVNSFLSDTDEEIQFIKDKCLPERETIRAPSIGAGQAREELARAGIHVAENTKTDFTLLYPNTCTLWDKVGIICREIYATEVLADKKLREKFHQLQEAGYGELPICMAKTQYSPLDRPGLKGRAEEVRRQAGRPVAAGAGIRGRSDRRHHDHAGVAQNAQPRPSTSTKTRKSSDFF